MGGIAEATAAVQAEAAEAGASAVARVQAHGGPFLPRKDWLMDPVRSTWGIAEQSDRLDGLGSRSAQPYQFDMAGGFRLVYIKGLVPGTQAAHVREFLCLFGELASVRLRCNDSVSGQGAGAQGRCEAFAEYVGPEAGAKAVMLLHGRRLAVTAQHLRIGAAAMARKGAAAAAKEQAREDAEATQAGEGSEMAYPHDGRQLSIFEFFYAVRDGDVESVRRLLQDGEVPASTPLVPRCFPPSGARRPPGQEALDQQRGRGIPQRGEGWPRQGCEGEEGDCALHLAARLGDSAMVEALLAGGADARQLNAQQLRPLDCVGVNVLDGHDDAAGPAGCSCPWCPRAAIPTVMLMRILPLEPSSPIPGAACSVWCDPPFAPVGPEWTQSGPSDRCRV